MGSFAEVVRPPVTGRLTKPRRTGLTAVMDKGLGLGAVQDVLSVAAEYIDLWKLAFGTAPLYPNGLLRSKVALLREHGVEPCPGGTLLESACLQGRAEELLYRCRDLGFPVVEVSDGTISMPAHQRRHLIQLARRLGFRVLSEVGKKRTEDQPTAAELIQQARADLECGVEQVIVEARESGRGVGVFDGHGQLRDSEVEAVAGALPPDRLIWEAPDKPQQQALILRFGPNVSLGNVAPVEALALEALRVGWRGDTLYAAQARLPALMGAEEAPSPAGEPAGGSVDS